MKAFLAVLASMCLVGCATYTTPGAGVSFAKISDVDIQELYAREPAAQFPARLSIARVQARGYSVVADGTNRTGAFEVISVRNIESEEDFERIAQLDQIIAAAPLTRILIPSDLSSTKDLRMASAQLKTDFLLMYTVDTAFRTNDRLVGPLQTVSLGFLTTKKAFVTATVSFMLVDVRTGYVYGTGESSVTETQSSNFWNSNKAVDKARFRAEEAAFNDALDEIENLWASVVKEYAASSS